MRDLTIKQKAFCRLMASGRCKNQSDAYRKAFKCPCTSAASIAVKASELMSRGKIQVMIKELSAPVDMKVRKTREEFLNMLEDMSYHDPGKMFDAHGNPLEIRDMPFAERMAVAGFEFVEDFTRVKKANGSEDAVATGFTKKFKIIDRHKFAMTYGKMMGCISDDPPMTDDSLKSLTIVFVNSRGERVDVDLNHPKKRRASSNTNQTHRSESSLSARYDSIFSPAGGSIIQTSHRRSRLPPRSYSLIEVSRRSKPALDIKVRVTTMHVIPFQPHHAI